MLNWNYKFKFVNLFVLLLLIYLWLCDTQPFCSRKIGTKPQCLKNQNPENPKQQNRYIFLFMATFALY